MTEKVCVIGGGPAGLTAALSAAERGAETVLLEKSERVGRKLLATGNGKCNFTNEVISPECYHTDQDSFVMRALGKFGPEDTVRWFRSLGIEPLKRHGTCIYPHSEQAASVLNALRAECDLHGVRILTACGIREIRRKKTGGFQVHTENEMIPADRLILATGSKAGDASNDGSGYEYAKQFGHRIIAPLPALCGLYCAEKEFFKSVAGVRTAGRITLCLEESETETAWGELQLTAYGISGIPVFQVSRTASRALAAGRKTGVRISFLPDFPDPEEYLSRRAAARNYRTFEALGNGLLNKNLWNALVKRAGLKPGADPAAASGQAFSALAHTISGSFFRVIRTGGFEQAQTCTGGVRLKDVDPDTMESRLVPGLYFAGEILDTDGICGGYNLQWCWTSGHLAGSAGRI